MICSDFEMEKGVGILILIIFLSNILILIMIYNLYDYQMKIHSIKTY